VWLFRSVNLLGALMPSTNINNFSIHQLLEMRRDIDRLLESKRSELRATLEELDRELVPGQASSLKGTKLEPKYRNPETGEKWAGRGRTPRWLVKEINAGRKREDFVIANPDKAGAANAGTGSLPHGETGDVKSSSSRLRAFSVN